MTTGLKPAIEKPRERGWNGHEEKLSTSVFGVSITRRERAGRKAKKGRERPLKPASAD